MSKKTASDRPFSPLIVMDAMLSCSAATGWGSSMVNAFRNTVIAVTLIASASVSIVWDFNSYIACALALVVSFAAGYCVERAFIHRSHRE